MHRGRPPPLSFTTVSRCLPEGLWPSIPAAFLALRRLRRFLPRLSAMLSGSAVLRAVVRVGGQAPVPLIGAETVSPDCRGRQRRRQAARRHRRLPAKDPWMMPGFPHRGAFRLSSKFAGGDLSVLRSREEGYRAFSRPRRSTAVTDGQQVRRPQVVGGVLEMMDLGFHRLDLPVPGSSGVRPVRESRLLVSCRSLASAFPCWWWGGGEGRYILIDGYRRVSALQAGRGIPYKR